MAASLFRTAIIASAALLLSVTAHAQEEGEPSEADKAALIAAEPVDVTIEFGNADAPVVIEEYGSLSCGHCSQFHKDDLPKLTQGLLKTGKAKLVLHSYIRNEPDLRGTMLLHCLSDNTERTQYLDVMFNMQEQWAYSENVSGALGDLVKVGGFDMAKFNSCLADKSLEMGLLKNLQVLGETRDIKGTPTFFINGEHYKGAPTAEQISKFVANLPAPAAKAAEAKPAAKAKK